VISQIKAATCIQQQKNRINANIHALSGIPSHDPSVQASEDSSCFRPRGYCDRHFTELHLNIAEHLGLYYYYYFFYYDYYYYYYYYDYWGAWIA
jgi:hypothetical protein